jgi:hypothetical protein
MAIRGAVGLGIGIGICLKDDLFLKSGKEYALIAMKGNQIFEKFKIESTLREYHLFCGFHINYYNFLNKNHNIEICDLCCYFTKIIPVIPVFSPHDTERRHVFEKSYIEKHIDNIEDLMSAALRLKYIDEGLYEIRINAIKTLYPHGGLPFKKMSY